MGLLPSSTNAFHEGVPPCPEGAVGYWATVLVDGKKMAMFLSRENPPSSESIFCTIDPSALIQVKTLGKDM
jgi:hypothetical protein